MDFSKWDNSINGEEMTKQIEEAKANPPQGDFGELPAGKYTVKIEKMEVRATKDGRPMFAVQCRVIGAAEDAKDDVVEYLSKFKSKMPCMFMNRVLAGTKNDANMIASVMGWLDKLESDTRPEFKSYSQFADTVLDIFEEVADAVELDVEYDADKFNSITILEVFDAE